MEENKERNRKIYEERLSGKTIADLSCEYGVCEQRIKHIYDQEQRKEDKKDDRLYQLLFALSDNDPALELVRAENINNEWAIYVYKKLNN